MESDAKLWQYIYYDQKPRKLYEEPTGNSSGKYVETSNLTSPTDDYTSVDQLCNQLLLHNNSEQNRKKNNLQKQTNHHLYNLNTSKNNHQTRNYLKLQLGFDLESNSKHSSLFKKLIYKSIFYKFNYLTHLLGLILALIGFICILKSTNYFKSFNLTNSKSASFDFSRLLPLSSFSAALKTNYTSFDQLATIEQLDNGRFLNSFERVLTVETDCAKYVGTVEENGFEFLGIQYAKPPINNFRFKKTVPIWKDEKLCKPKQIKQARKFSSECFQLNPFNKNFFGNEDCLYLNVFTPRIDNSAFLDVMIYFHPGFGQFGSSYLANGALAPSTSLAKKLNIVFVSFNYRLDALGFFPLEKFIEHNSTENKGNKKLNDTLSNFLNSTLNVQPKNIESGNYALFDQLTAVEWVKRNIRQFGGNPNRLILFGSDGGAASILALLSYKKFRESISKVWLAGPAVYLDKNFSLIKFLSKNRDLNQQQTKSTKFNQCRTIECFQSLSPKEIIIGFLNGDESGFKINDQNDLPIQGIYPNQWILVDNNLVNDAYPFKRKLNYDKLQFLIGTSTNSIEMWPGPDLRKWNWNQYVKYTTTSLDSFGSTISQIALKLYPPSDLKNSNFKSNNFANVRRNSFDLINQLTSLDKKLNEKILTNAINQQDNLNDIDQLNYFNLKTNAKRKTSSPESLYTRMVSDIKQTCPINRVSKNLVKFYNSTVFRYIAVSEPSKQVKLFGHNSRYGFHLWDLIAFFDQVHTFIEPSKSDLLFVKQMQNMIINFIKKDEYFIDKNITNENVLELKNLVDFKNNEIFQNDEMIKDEKNKKDKTKKDSEIKWLAYPKSVALIGENINFVSEYNTERCKFWESIGLDKYAWVC